jgi:hypothetical protein
MYEPADPLLLDRDTASQDAQTYFAPTLAFLADLVNYGTHLIPRSLNSHVDDDTTRAVVCAALLKHTVGMMDAAVALLEAGHSTMALAPVRSAFESGLYLEFVLKADTAHRARVYLVGEYRRQRTFLQRALDPSTAPESFNAVFATYGTSSEDWSPEKHQAIKTQIAELEKLLAVPSLAGINALYDRKRRNKPFDPDWYQLLNFNSVRAIAKAVDQLAPYELFYNAGSRVVHARSPTHQWRVVASDHMALKAIRHLEDAHEIKGGVAYVGMRAYRLIIQRYLPHTYDAFKQKYLDDWRTPYLDQTRVRYEYATPPTVE